MLQNETDSSVKVAVRLKPLSPEEASNDDTLCINVVAGENQVVAGSDLFFTFDHVFGVDASQESIFDDCVTDLVNSSFEGFNATIVAYGQTGSGKTFTMGSSADHRMTADSMGIIPRVIQILFETIVDKEANDPTSSYKVHVQFLEIYGEDIRDLLDKTKTSKVIIRETAAGEVFVSGAREEVVSSTTQMMKTLEEGSKCRTTAATCMNNESSRSHAIFTIILEHTIHSGSVIDDAMLSSLDKDDDNTTDSPLIDKPKLNNINHHSTAEVRRSKFHFVDLAGSERIKRTKAQGTQLKEGIDINKGLLALGNVISALGDDQKKGKVHVPYRDSKLTRILQDSLGGNSKTLFICCVSPSSSNFHESVNALKYANRARNIKNKPVVNRDPTLVVIDELKELVQSLAIEMLDIKKMNNLLEINNERFNQEALEELSILNFNSNSKTLKSRNRSFIQQQSNNESIKPPNRSQSPFKNKAVGSVNGIGGGEGSSGGVSHKDINDLKSKLIDSDFEIQRLTDQLKMLRVTSSDLSERVILAESERDYYKIKFTSTNQVDITLLPTDTTNEHFSEGEIGIEKSSSDDENQEINVKEKDDFVSVMMKYRQENENLRSQLVILNEAKQLNMEAFHDAGESIENELTTSVARVIAQTKEQLLQEAKRLEIVAEECGLSKSSLQQSLLGSSSNGGDDNPDYSSDSENEHEAKLADTAEEEQTFQLRQKMLSTQLLELGESIVLKENLVIQLKKSQDQYSLMKAFYEQKLTVLQKEVDAKEEEREKLLSELQDISNTQHQTALQIDQEKRLKEELKRKDDELKSLKKKQEELSSLSQVQAKYLQQLRKMENDIEIMKRQKVDLSKVLQVEKKKHLTILHEKVKEVEKLKRELLKKSGEIKKLSQEKTRAEDRAKEAIREGAALRKRKNDIILKNEVNSNRLSNKAIVKISSVKSSVTVPRFLTLDELKTRKQLVNSVNKIIEREASIDLLKRQCDQQLSLLAQRDDLENQKAVIIAAGETASSGNTEEQLIEIDDKLNSVNQQLKLRNSNIMKAQNSLDQGEEVSDLYDKICDMMKRNLSPYLLRMLFEMIVKAQQSANLFKDILDKNQLKQKSLKQDLETEKMKFNTMLRQHEQEIIQLTNDYEEKLQGLFENSSVIRGIQAEAATLISNGASSNTDDTSSSLEHHSSKIDGSIDSYKMIIAILTDQCNNFKNQKSKSIEVNNALKTEMNELNALYKQTLQELEESENLIEFLENERHLFRDMANDFRVGILTYGGPSGQSIINQIREKSLEKEKECVARNPQGYLKSSKMDDIDFSMELNSTTGPDDDSESVLNEFNEIGDEITRTGTLGVHNKQPKGSGVVYDRLTNPVNYTGSMKNIFTNDLIYKKARVQKIKNQTIVPHKNSNLTGVDDNNWQTYNRKMNSGLESDMASHLSTGRESRDSNNNSFEYFEEQGKENHEPIMLSLLKIDEIINEDVEVLSQPRSRANSDANDSVVSNSRNSSKPGSPSAGKRRSVLNNGVGGDMMTGKSINNVSDRLFSVTTQSTRLKQNKVLVTSAKPNI